MRISVHLMVRDGAAVVPRALRSLRGVVDEVCFVDTGSTDGTSDVVARTCAELGIHCEGIAVSHLPDPELFFPDAAESYAPYPVPELTGKYLLRDWAAARNLGLASCRGDYVLKLDADDEALCPGEVAKVADFLDHEPEIDIVCSPYEVMNPTLARPEYTTLYARMWRNRPTVRFREVCHENVDYLRRADRSNWSVWRGLVFRDHRDAAGLSRVSHRNLKVLLHEYALARREGRPPSKHVEIYLADELADVMPNVALEVLGTMGGPYHPADQAWLHNIAGRACQAKGYVGTAEGQYAAADVLGHGRSQLARDVLALRRARVSEPERVEHCRKQLGLSLSINDQSGRYYPQYASRTEIEEARALLEKM